ncbi:hypothetical protein B0T26DRAFT_643587 [Lasiosphaeria miniovina]|uniref:Metallo-beta-lactamase domain-containing protein n=1 Tax=Lasiosphaeria miniovina TaxID=1954250 RepID=A0AA40AWQ0_9PEZI|nr:uncharacterized protein B0T26DRAFT_643587 [Lasiosphaeria miniovina]KAK0723388.1 hypothetical protein B0T26DRAFT_643587 [Lasiosphaeria miniovina]
MAAVVTVSALDAGHLTLPERLFVTDADPDLRATVPSLSFLVRHTAPSGATTAVLFDLGVKRNIDGYTPAQRAHIAQRQPVVVSPDCADSLRRGHSPTATDGEQQQLLLLDPTTDVDVVILSHVHWDHVGTPSDFGRAVFAVGAGTLNLLRHGAGPLYPAALFNADELPAARTLEFPPAPASPYDSHTAEHAPAPTPNTPTMAALLPPTIRYPWRWEPLPANDTDDPAFPAALDLFGDGSVRVVDSPGHLFGHVNLLLRTAPRRYVYLGGDCCHDPRILRGEKGIALYDDGCGGLRSVHVDTGAARRTLGRIARFADGHGDGDGDVEVEVVVAHDAVWRDRNRHRFWPGTL